MYALRLSCNLQSSPDSVAGGCAVSIALAQRICPSPRTVESHPTCSQAGICCIQHEDLLINSPASYQAKYAEMPSCPQAAWCNVAVKGTMIYVELISQSINQSINQSIKKNLLRLDLAKCRKKSHPAQRHLAHLTLPLVALPLRVLTPLTPGTLTWRSPTPL